MPDQANSSRLTLRLCAADIQRAREDGDLRGAVDGSDVALGRALQHNALDHLAVKNAAAENLAHATWRGAEAAEPFRNMFSSEDSLQRLANRATHQHGASTQQPGSHRDSPILHAEGKPGANTYRTLSTLKFVALLGRTLTQASATRGAIRSSYPNCVQEEECKYRGRSTQCSCKAHFHRARQRTLVMCALRLAAIQPWALEARQHIAARSKYAKLYTPFCLRGQS